MRRKCSLRIIDGFLGCELRLRAQKLFLQIKNVMILATRQLSKRAGKDEHTLLNKNGNVVFACQGSLP
jgi:hypothetical protein